MAKRICEKIPHYVRTYVNKEGTKRETEFICRWCRKRFNRKDSRDKHVRNRVCIKKPGTRFVVPSSNELNIEPEVHVDSEMNCSTPKPVKRKKAAKLSNGRFRIMKICSITNADLVCGICKHAFASKERRNAHIQKHHPNVTDIVITMETKEQILKETNNVKRIEKRINSKRKLQDIDCVEGEEVKRKNFKDQTFDSSTLGIFEEVYPDDHLSSEEDGLNPRQQSQKYTRNPDGTTVQKHSVVKALEKLRNSETSESPRSLRVGSGTNRVGKKPEIPHQEIVYHVSTDKHSGKRLMKLKSGM